MGQLTRARYVSAICLLSLNATAAGPLFEGLDGVPADQVILSQAFFYGIWAAILYFVDASLMTVTFWGAASGHYSKDFNLTNSQRTLMLQTIMVLMYMLLGALVFSNIEGWQYLDGVYWSAVTIFTVGFGDFTASTNLARVLLFPYALIGIISLGLVVYSIRSMILERGRLAIDARIEDKNRRRVIRALTNKGQDKVLTPIEREPTFDNPPPGELERRRSEFDLMRKIQERANSKRRWMAMATSTAVWLTMWLLGAFIFLECERKYQPWTYLEAVYFCFVSLLTIGYGDVVPVSNAGKSFFVFWGLMALPTVTVLISNAEDTVVKLIRDATITLGNITILPGEEGFTANVKHIFNQLTCGLAFKSSKNLARDVEREGRSRGGEDLPGYKLKDKLASGDGHKHGRLMTASSNASSSSRGRSRSGPGDAAEPASTSARRSISLVRERLDGLPTGHDLNLLLVSEIQTVARHAREPKPRRYSFEEWAWYLKLLGEDERDPDTHRKAKPKEKHRRARKGPHRRRRRGPLPRGNRGPHPGNGAEGGGHGQAEAEQDEEAPGEMSPDQRPKWSWVGGRSPLTGGKEESEWILERLMDRLKESLLETKRSAEDSAAASP